MQKILKSDYDNCIRILEQLNDSFHESFLQKTIGFLNGIPAIEDIFPDKKISFLVPTDKKPKKIRISKIIKMFNETCIVHKERQAWIISHYKTGVRIKSGSPHQTITSLIDETTEFIKNLPNGKQTFFDKIKEFKIINEVEI